MPRWPKQPEVDPASTIEKAPVVTPAAPVKALAPKAIPRNWMCKWCHRTVTAVEKPHCPAQCREQGQSTMEEQA